MCEREREKERERPVLETRQRTFASTTPNFEMLCSLTRQGRGSHVCSLGLEQVQAPLRTRRRRRGRCVCGSCGKAERLAPGDVDDMRMSSHSSVVVTVSSSKDYEVNFAAAPQASVFVLCTSKASKLSTALLHKRQQHSRRCAPAEAGEACRGSCV